MAEKVAEKLAVRGGEPVRSESFPGRTPFGKEEEELVLDALRSQNLFYKGGTHVAALQEEFAEFYGARRAVACTSGTAALHLAVGAVDPAPGDEIITTPITDLGTIIPILYQNAVPVFADVNAATGNMDPASTEAKITERTKAIILVHLFGNPAPVDEFVEIAKRHGVMLIEDCSQAHATKYKGRYVGTFGDIGTYSFQQSKHMTTGDGGCVITNSEEIGQRMQLFADKNYNRGDRTMDPRMYFGLAPNYRMNELTGAVGRAQLRKVRGVVEKRIALGARLNEKLAKVEGVMPATVTPEAEFSGWAYPLHVRDASKLAEFKEALGAEGLWAGVGYIGKPIFLCADSLKDRKTYGDSGFPFTAPGAADPGYSEGACPGAEEFMEHVLTFAYNENWTEADIDDVARAIAKVAAALL